MHFQSEADFSGLESHASTHSSLKSKGSLLLGTLLVKFRHTEVRRRPRVGTHDQFS